MNDHGHREFSAGGAPSRWRSLLPVSLLLLIALTQIVLSRTSALSPW